MDVLSLDLLRTAPRGGVPLRPGPGRAQPGGLRRRWLARLVRLVDPLPADGGGRPGSANAPGTGPGPDAALAALATAHTRRLLLGWTAAQIVFGLVLLVTATVLAPVTPAIDPHLDGTALSGTVGGLLLWTMFGLLASIRSIPGRGGLVHFTFNLPFIGAATVLGGPAAGAWVALLSTIERRELEELPWYAIAANHASMVAAAVGGGLAWAASSALVTALSGDPRLAEFVSVIVGGVALELVAALLTAVTIRLRDRMSRGAVVAMLIEDFGRMTLLEIGLIWVLAIAFTQVGWWAPLIVVAIVLAATGTVTDDVPDTLSGFPRKAGFRRRLERKVGWMRRGVLDGGTLLYLDLNGFHLVNNSHGHEVGDEALAAISRRIATVCPRRDDLLSRLMGDEFAVFLPGLVSTEVAIRKADELVEAIAKPIPTTAGPVTVGVAIGVVVTQAWGGVPSADRLLRQAEQAMYLAKRRDGRHGAAELYDETAPSPWDEVVEDRR